MKPLRVVVLDDSAICRAQLRSFLEEEGDIRVVGEAPSGEGVLGLLRETAADLLLVDLQMPRTDGHQTISTVMAHTPLPILVVTGQPLGPERTVVFESIRRGALDLAEKPGGLDVAAQKRLRATVRRLASLPVVRHVAGKLLERPAHVPPVRPSVPPPAPTDGPLVVGIGASAGGPLPLSSVLGEWGEDFGAAVLVVQHLPAAFFPAFAEFVQGRTRLRVVEVKGPEPLREGHVYVPSGDSHLVLGDRGEARLSHAPARQGHRPAVDELFESLARHAGSRAAALVLSGIGQDGTQGLLSLRARGGLCLAQDRTSSAVWGMPRSALESGAAERALPPLGLAEFVAEWTRVNRRKAR